MILTVTMNPSVDTRYQLDELVIDDVNRVTPEVERLAHMVARPWSAGRRRCGNRSARRPHGRLHG